MKLKLSLAIFLLYITNLIKSQLIYSPFEESEEKLKDICNSGLLFENKAVLAESGSGMQIFDITNEQDPKEIYSKKPNDKGSAQSVSILKSPSEYSFVILSNGLEGICIYDINKKIEEIICLKLEFVVEDSIQLNPNFILSTGKGKVSLLSLEFSQNNEYISNIKHLKTWETGASSSNRIQLDIDQQFAFIAADSKGVAILSTESMKNLQENALKIIVPYYETAFDLVLTNDKKYLYMIDLIKGVYISNIEILYKKEQIQQGDITGERLIAPPSRSNSLKLSSDSKYLFLGIRTYGIQIFDIQDRLNPKLIESLDSPGFAYSISFSPNQDTLLFCNGYSMKIYKKLKPNFNKDFPNLFNDIQSNVYSLGRNVTIDGQEKYIPNSSPWSLRIDKNNDFLYLAGARTGTQVWNIKKNPLIPEFHSAVDVTDQSNPADGLGLTSKHMYIGEGWGGVKIVNIEDPNNHILKSHIELNGDSDSIEVTSDENYMVVANGGTGVSIVNIKDKENPIETGVWSNNRAGGSVENVLLNRNNDLVFVSIRYYGLLILDIKDKENDPIEVSEYYSGMCEYVTLSSDESHIYLSDGTKGITILNIEDIQNPKYINSVPLNGFPTKMRLIPYEPYWFLLVTTRDKELLQAVNVTDVHHPTLFAKYAPELEQAYDLEISSDKKFCYMLTSKGLRVLPLVSPLNVHTEFIQLNSDGSKGKPIQDSVLQIGANVRLLFVPIGVGKPVKIDKINYYNNYLIDQQPSWMAFDQQQMAMNLRVDKSSLTEGSETENNIIFINLLVQVQKQDFIDPLINIDESLSNQIREDTLRSGYLSNDYFVTEKFNSNQDLFNYDDNIYTQPIKNKIIQVLQESKFRIPVRFTVANSLHYRRSVEEHIIQTQAEYLYVTMHIKSGNAKFVNKQYSGSLAILSDEKDKITFEGPKSLVIRNLVDDLRIQNYTQNFDDIILDIEIEDKVNYSQKYINQTYTESTFIQLHEGVTLDGNNNLQKQFNQIYENGEVEIEEEFTFQFSDTTFDSPARIKLAYSFEMENEKGEYESFPQDFWLVPNINDRRISGTPSQYDIYSRQKVKILASDGYSHDEDIIEIKIWNFTIFWLILELMEKLGPFVAIFTIWEYKYEIYGKVYKSHYTYQSEEVYEGEEFRKIIPLMQDTLVQGQWLFSLLDFKLKQNQYWTKFGDMNKTSLINLIKEESKTHTKEIEQQGIEIGELDKQDSRLYKVVIGLGAYYVLKNVHINSYKAFLELRKYGKTQNLSLDWYRSFVLIDHSYDESRQFSAFPKLYVQDSTLAEFFIKQKKLHENELWDIEFKGKLYDIKMGNLFLQEKKKNYLESQDLGYYTKYNMYLLKECLYAAALGVHQNGKLQFPRMSYGISIHAKEHELNAVKGYVKVGESNCLNDGYGPSGLQSNQPLPSWLSVSIKNGSIIIQGTPKRLDRGEINIQIYHETGCIARKFSLNVLGKRKEENLIDENIYDNENIIDDEQISLQIYDQNAVQHIAIQKQNAQVSQIEYLDKAGMIERKQKSMRPKTMMYKQVPDTLQTEEDGKL